MVATVFSPAVTSYKLQVARPLRGGYTTATRRLRGGYTVVATAFSTAIASYKLQVTSYATVIRRLQVIRPVTRWSHGGYTMVELWLTGGPLFHKVL